MGLENYEKDMYSNIGNMDSYDNPKNSEDMKPLGSITHLKNNPPMKAEFDLNFLLKYGSGGVEVTPAALPAPIQVKQPYVVFGNTDYRGAYFRALTDNPLQGGWAIRQIGVFGRDVFSLATVPIESVVEFGDLVFEYEVTSGAVYYAYVIIKCQQVAYGSLLSATSSDTFEMINIRFNIPDTTKVAQYNQNISIYSLSLFGKTETDRLTPTAFKNPEQFQVGIVDIPLVREMNKQTGFAGYMDFDVEQFTWSFAVKAFNVIK